MVIREDKSVNLGLDVDSLDGGIRLESISLDLVIEVADVTNNCVVLHLLHVVQSND